MRPTPLILPILASVISHAMAYHDHPGVCFQDLTTITNQGGNNMGSASTTAGYTLSASASSYVPGGGTITVQVSGSLYTYAHGLLLYAASSSSAATHYGSWTNSSDFQTLDAYCSGYGTGSTIGHVNSGPRLRALSGPSVDGCNNHDYDHDDHHHNSHDHDDHYDDYACGGDHDDHYDDYACGGDHDDHYEDYACGSSAASSSTSTNAPAAATTTAAAAATTTAAGTAATTTAAVTTTTAANAATTTTPTTTTSALG
ncbi:hypothetical protein BDK51DRAFT_37102, partial [Blyttiomyces helicus]